MVDRRHYHPEALESALTLVRRVTSAETTAVVEALICARRVKRSVKIAALARPSEDGDPDATCRRLGEASREFAIAFGVPLIQPAEPRYDGEDHRPDLGRPRDELASMFVSPAFLNVLSRPMPRITPLGAPEPDVLTATWVAIAAACPKSGRGHHLVLRCVRPGPREPVDIAQLIAAQTANVHLIAGDSDGLEATVLRAELHGGATPSVVVVDRCLLGQNNSADDDDDFDGKTDVFPPTARLTIEDVGRILKLRGLRNTYLWRAPEDFTIDGELAAMLGGAMGPLVPTHDWRNAVISDFAPGIGREGIKALAARVVDPRDAGALAAVASVVVSAFGIDLDDAAILVANSLSPKRLHVPPPLEFDARLVVCDEEGQLLLARATELAREGARILFWGPPGGGKSTFAQALAAAMGRAAQSVTSAAVLARGWGVTERIIAKLWSRAADDGVCLIIDEIDSLCGVREPGVSSGNAYLVRSLTNEFLRAFDAHGGVPVIATANHLEAIDDAVRRRFTFVIEVRGELTPEAERFAWRSVFDVEPPTGWTPIGANISDFANAVRRSRMLGLQDAVSLAAALERSREARLGPSAHVRRVHTRLQ